MEDTQPHVSTELIRYLQVQFPVELPEGPTADPHQINYQIGQQNVIKHLAALHQQQEESLFNV
jgi:hypothetical protein